MAINWRQREPILRVLAAVYAELGEDAFKGRYDKIARLYGDTASYSAIKSFFAKEIVKLAEDMKARIANHRHDFTDVHIDQRSRVVRQPIHMTFDDLDDEIVIVGERRAGSELLNARSASNLEQGRTSLLPLHEKYNRNSRAYESSAVDVLDPENLPPDTYETSCGAEKEKQVSETGTKRPMQRRKRRYSAIEESDHSPLSFGYVSSEGRHRCALCMTELLSADMLRKHESLSKLHLTNLKDPAIVLRGQTALAEHNSLSDHTSRQQSRPNPAISNAATFFSRQNPEHREQRSISRHRQGDNEAANENDTSFGTTHFAESTRAQAAVFPLNINIPTDGDDAGNGPNPDIEVVEPSFKVKTKEPAQADLNNEPAATRTQSHSQTGNAVFTEQQADPSAIFQRLDGDQQLKDVPPTWIAHTLLSNGMKLLAKKCIEEHPELKAGFYKCMQDLRTISQTP